MTMSNNTIEDFFDRLAPNWEEHNKVLSDEGKALISSLPIKSGIKVLDLGCGKGIATSLLYSLSQNKVTGMDLSSEMIKGARKNISSDKAEFIQDDFYSTKLKGFDFIVIFNAYPHFVRVDEFIRKLYSSLNDNGYFAIVHDLNRNELSMCHQGLNTNISRNLLPVNKEAVPFKEYFNIMRAEEDDSSYLILGQKKS